MFQRIVIRICEGQVIGRTLEASIAQSKARLELKTRCKHQQLASSVVESQEATDRVSAQA